MKVQTNFTIDHELREKAKIILHRNGQTLSGYITKVLTEMIQNDDKNGNLK